MIEVTSLINAVPGFPVEFHHNIGTGIDLPFKEALYLYTSYTSYQQVYILNTLATATSRDHALDAHLISPDPSRLYVPGDIANRTDLMLSTPPPILQFTQ